jgi:hypothetical protein
VLAACALFALNGTAALADAASVKKELQAIYTRMDAAAAKKDMKTSFAHYAPDYVSHGPNGRKTTLTDLKAQIGPLMAQAKSIRSKSTVQKVVLKGSNAIATVKEDAIIVMVNPQNPQQTMKLDINGASEATWVKTSAGWRVKSSRTLNVTTKVNGQPVQQPQ